MKQSLRRVVPSLVTFSGLVCAISAVLLAIHDDLSKVGLCIMVGYLLDGLDGGLARWLGATSDFGLQLDSLVDMVTFGVAPSVLAYQHLRELGVSPAVGWVACAAYVIGGAFRLARFNLLPQKEPRDDSVGLTISTSGATVALSVLCSLSYGQHLILRPLFPALLMALALLMISRIRFPDLASILRKRWLSLAGLGVASLLAIWLSPQLVWLGLNGGYVSYGLVRALYGLIR